MIILSQERHFTVTSSPGNLTNLFEPHFGQIGQARIGSISVQWDEIVEISPSLVHT